MKNTLVKNILYGAGIILLFTAISYAFVPEVLSGKIVNQSDISGWTGMTNEVITYNEDHPEDPSFWTNSMFGGMPTISMYGIFKGDWTAWLYDFLLTGARPATYIFISLLGGFLLMLAARFRHQASARNRRGDSHSFLFLQHADHPGRTQYEDAGHRLYAMGARRNGLYIQVRTGIVRKD